MVLNTWKKNKWHMQEQKSYGGGICNPIILFVWIKHCAVVSYDFLSLTTEGLLNAFNLFCFLSSPQINLWSNYRTSLQIWRNTNH